MTTPRIQGPHAPEPAPADHQWRRRRLLSVLIRVGVFAAPAAAGLVTWVVLARLVPAPTTALQTVLWYLGISAAMLLVVRGAERMARRLLPLAALLNLSLLFPDKAPKRFALARRVGRPRDLQEQLRRARESGGDNGDVGYMQTVLELVAALSVHDKQTRGHSERVRVYTDLLAEEMELSEADRARLRWASLLHDIGKLLVPQEYLTKPGALDAREWASIKRHPEEGARLIAPLASWLGSWAAAVEDHHERWDGTGYPHGRKGNEISLAGRIVAVADSYEVMTAIRPYRKPIGVAAARSELVRCSGSQFDPEAVRAFLQISVGRLWRTGGIGSLAAQLPLLGQLSGLISRLGTGLSTAAVTGGLIIGGVVPAPHTAHASRAVATAPPGPSAAATAPPTRPPSAATAPPGPSAAATRQPVPGSPPPGSPPPPARAPAPTANPAPRPTPTPTPPPPPPPVATPRVTMPGGTSLNEASTYLAGGSFSDSSGTSWISSVDYGDGSGTQPLSLVGKVFALNHVYAEACSCTVRVTVTNNQGRSGNAVASVSILSTSPSVGVNGSSPGKSRKLSGTISVTDADGAADSFSATIDYGDGSATQLIAVSPASPYALSYRYSGAGTYTITVTVTDDDGARGVGTQTLTVG